MKMAPAWFVNQSNYQNKKEEKIADWMNGRESVKNNRHVESIVMLSIS